MTSVTYFNLFFGSVCVGAGLILGIGLGVILYSIFANSLQGRAPVGNK